MNKTPFVSERATRTWKAILDHVSRRGEVVEVEQNIGGLVKTLEQIRMSVTVPMSEPIVLCKKRKLRYEYMYADPYWILSGSDLADDIVPYCPSLSKYLDEDKSRFFGAYGPPVFRQMNYVVEELLNNPTSRRACLTIWKESPGKSRDIPCTLSMQFMLRDRQLHLNVSMRSSDLFIGLPYDLFAFSCIGIYVALALKGRGALVEPSDLTIFIGSAHIYEKNLGAVVDCLKMDDNHTFTGLMLDEFDDELDFMRHLSDLRDVTATKSTFLKLS